MKNNNIQILSFISNESFDKAVAHVINALDEAKQYEESIKQSLEDGDIFSSALFSNAIDPFSMQFGMSLSSEENWIAAEVRRQLYKTFEQKIGEFHQMVLGAADGWVDLGVGDETKVDLCNEEMTKFIELKNKHNTCNSDALAKVQEKLINVLDNHENSKAYWAYIIPNVKKKQSITLWTKGGGKNKKNIHPGLYKAWGADVYGIVTGDPSDLHKTYKAVDIAVKRLKSGKDSLDTIGDRVVKLLNEHISEIKEQVFYKTVADRKAAEEEDNNKDS